MTSTLIVFYRVFSVVSMLQTMLVLLIVQCCLDKYIILPQLTERLSGALFALLLPMASIIEQRPPKDLTIYHHHHIYRGSRSFRV